jgi:hypothetical protein
VIGSAHVLIKWKRNGELCVVQSLYSTIKGNSNTYLAVKGAMGARSARRRRKDPPSKKKKRIKFDTKSPTGTQHKKTRKIFVSIVGRHPIRSEYCQNVSFKSMQKNPNKLA